MTEWWRLEAATVAAHFGVKPETGLAEAEARRRLAEGGANRLETECGPSPFSLLIAQVKDFMVAVLVGAALISFLLGEYADGATILAIVVLNIVLGFVQEYRAEHALRALRELAAPQARVRREGRIVAVPTHTVVPGDILVLEAGDKVAADARLVRAVALAADEAPLTGESVPVAKDPRPLSGNKRGLGERTNMVFAGTTIVAGRGEAVVVATGMATEIGQIAGLVTEAAPGPTPLQERLDQVGRWLVLACLFVCGAVGAAGLVRGESLRTMFLAAVSLAVAAIPEGLPAVVTIALALGVQRMAKRAAIVRRLPAVETLGCTTVICTDKTGTLTRNEMTVAAVAAAGVAYTVGGRGYDPRGEILDPQGRPVSFKTWPEDLTKAHPFAVLLLAAAVCNNARLLPPDGKGKWQGEGDPTEAALLVLAAKAGLSLPELPRLWRRVGEAPFDAERKRMSVVCRGPAGEEYLFVKGAADGILPLCREALTPAGTSPFPLLARQQEIARAEAMARRGMRVLALACRRLSPAEARSREEPVHLEKDLVFLGLVGMVDPPRAEVAGAVQLCRQAGIKTIMITGDHPFTARAVGEEIGLLRSGERVATGEELNRMPMSRLMEEAEKIKIYARVSPRHKLQIVRALKARGHVVAMTGDGINDAPAVKEADIGVAMGKSGTEVTKEAATLVIMDDNFATIVAAVEEGRAIYDNIRKFIRYLLGCNLGEILTMFLGMLLGLPLPLLPLQILWINLVTDGLPALALGLEPPERGIMERPPRSRGEGIFARGLWAKILWQGTAIGLSTLTAFVLMSVFAPGELARARTVAFSVLVFSQLLFALACHSEEGRLGGIGKNPYLLWTVAVSALMQLAVIYLPWLARLFAVVPLGPADWSAVAIATAWSALLGQAYRPGGKIIRRFSLGPART
ncbi:MAG: cation-translocating P-type ATPase [Bacillota bacterium]